MKLLTKMDGWISEIVDYLVEAVNYWTGLRRVTQIRLLVLVYLILGLLGYEERPAIVGTVSLIMTLTCGGIVFLIPGEIRDDWVIRALRVGLVIGIFFDGCLHVALMAVSWYDLELLGSGACLALIFYASTSHDPKDKSRLKQMISKLIPSGNPQVNLDPIKS